MSDFGVESAPDAAAPPAFRGLNAREAAARLSEHGPNTVARGARIPLWARVATQLRDPLVLVLLAAAVLTALTGDLADTAVILLVVTVNTVVGVIQEVRADKAVTALSDLSAPTVRVLRDGGETEISSAEVVPGDVVLLEEGDIVPADADLLDASALLVDESTVTGESVPVDKTAPAEGADDGAAADAARLQAGTVVARGRGVALVTATGAASTLGRIASLITERPGPTPLQRRLAQLGRVLAVIVIALCVVVFLLGLVRGRPVEEMAVTAISLAVAAVPESLPAVVTLGLALGARRMAARRAIVRNLPAVETLGSVTVLATDKTGTLTEGRMVAQRLWTPYGTADVSGTGYTPIGAILVDGRRADERDAHLRELLTAAALCNDAALVPPAEEDPDASWTVLGDPTEAALLTAAAKLGLDRDSLRAEHPRVAEAPFDSARKRMTTVHQDRAGEIRAAFKGAPEVVLTSEFIDGSAELLASARDAADRLAAQGHRVLAVATRSLDTVPARVEDAENGMTLLGLIGISDPPKASARETVRACRAAGITPVMVTGDHPATARAIAGRLGIADDGAQVLTGAELRHAAPSQVVATRVFARTTPEQKTEIIQAWRAEGAVTAMNGDGVNDGPALRQADIGVAMGRRGTEVARQAADLVLADDEIGTVVAAVEEGRRVYTNIRRFLLYGLAGGAAEIAVMLLGPAFGLAVPLVAAQILWINLLTHGLTGVALGAEPTEPGSMRRPPRPPGQSILGDGLWQRVLALGAVVTVVTLAIATWAYHDERPWQSMLFLTLLLAQLGIVMGLRNRPLTRDNPSLPAAVLGSVALGLLGLYVPLLQNLLDTEALNAADLAVTFLGAVVGFAAARTQRWLRTAAH